MIEIESNAMSFVEIPVFEGFALRQWIDCMEAKFARVRIPESWKLNLAKSLIEGEAKTFLNQTWLHLGSWDSLKAALLFRFGGEDDQRRFVLLEKTRDYDKRFDLTDRRFDQITQIRTRIDTNPLSSMAKGTIPVADDPFQKIAMPRFYGSSPFGWLLRIEKYFQSCQLVEDERLGRLSECLEGEAFCWYKKELYLGGFSSWNEFNRRLVARFAPVKRCSRRAATEATEVISQTVVEPTKSLETEKTAAEDSLQKLVVEVAHEKTLASEPLVSTAVLEACQNENGSEKLSPGVLCTHSASKVFDTLPLETEMMNMKMEQDKLSKSWKFKFKQGDVITEDGSLDAATSFEYLDLQKEVILQMEQVSTLETVTAIDHEEELVFFVSTEPNSILVDNLQEASEPAMGIVVVHEKKSITQLDLHLEVAVSSGISTCFTFTRSSCNVFNEWALRGLRFWRQQKNRRCSKSWRFKFKKRDVTAFSQKAENHVLHQNMEGSSNEDLCGSSWVGDNGAIQRALPYYDICSKVLVTHQSKNSAHVLIERGTTRLSYPCSEPRVGFMKKKKKQRKNLKAWKFKYKYMELQRVKSVCGHHKLKNKKQQFLRLTTREGRSENYRFVHQGSSSRYYRIQSVINSVQVMPRQERQLFDHWSILYRILCAAVHVSLVKGKLRSSWDPGGGTRLDKAEISFCVWCAMETGDAATKEESTSAVVLIQFRDAGYFRGRKKTFLKAWTEYLPHLVVLVISGEAGVLPRRDDGNLSRDLVVQSMIFLVEIDTAHLLIQITFTSTAQRTVTPVVHKLFGIWHRWRSRDWLSCEFGLVTTWVMHITSFHVERLFGFLLCYA